MGDDIAADSRGSLGFRCMIESEGEGTRSTGLDVVRWEGDNSQDTGPMVEEGTRKRDRAHGIDRVCSSSLICRGAEGEAAHRQGTRVTLIVRGGADESSLEVNRASL